ncbi:ubiquitin carboxyl-terminal hydrolase [Cantharellus anzutake]|uniref:ubiquitin carboxyl-terminal hydrolase n=1 Tax=Cantharellus anzutake TaxID=1750568 RepID=UPI001906E16C|nr:ubiquitin carboxyl-terminal hydrolase [Cantharellus anzutake]KAF8324439.1 ubiquitin carboxyl-terminal hydrolase [Cantharellus anzutake]
MASDEEHESGWQTMESDPGVFDELLRTLGVPLTVDDLYSLDAESLAAIQPVHAFIFLFKWIGSGESGVASTNGGEYDDEFTGFFANQVVNNACATIAVINGICNIEGLKVGTEIEQLKEFSGALDPQTRGEVITSDNFFRSAHNSLSPPPSISLAELDIQREKSGDAYHFIVYLPHRGYIYELDGLKRSPVRHVAYSEGPEGWTPKAKEVIEARIATYPAGSLHFNLLAIRDDPIPKLEGQLEQAQAEHQADHASALAQQIALENEKRERWKFENSLRRHNHLRTIHALLLAMASSGRLEGAMESARQKMKDRIEIARKNKGSGLS